MHPLPFTFDITSIGISPLLLPLRSTFVPFTLPNLLWFYTLEGTRVQGHKGIYSLTFGYFHPWVSLGSTLVAFTIYLVPFEYTSIL